MNAKKIVLFLVIADLVAVAGWGVAQVGFAGLLRDLLSHPAGLVCAAELLVALGVAAVLMARDARARGVSPVPYLALTLFLGTIGPLLYLLRRRDDASAAARAQIAAQAG